MYDVIVVGAGIIGSWTAYHLSKSGKSTLLLDKFDLPHTRGSSHGQTRIFRTTDVSPFFQKIAIKSLQHYKQLEADSGNELYIQTGRLHLTKEKIPKANSDTLASWKENALNVGHHFDLLSATELKEKYHLNYANDIAAFYEPGAGIFRAAKCLETLHTQFKKHHGQILDGCQVQEIAPSGKHGPVLLKTSKGHFQARKVIICAGPWSKSLVSQLNLPLKSAASAHVFWAVKTPGIHSAANGFPAVSHFPYVYAVPEYEYPGMMKVGPEQQEFNEISPEQSNWSDGEVAAKVTAVSNYLKQHFPELDAAKPVIIEPCMHTFTPDRLPVVDFHPEHPNILIGTGLSGGGFRDGGEIGHALSCMALDKIHMLDYDLKPFSIGRFDARSHL